MIKQIEHIKKFALQDNSALSVQQLGEAIARMCDDAIREAVEQKRAPDELACDDIYHDFLLQWEEVKYCDVCGTPIRR